MKYQAFIVNDMGFCFYEECNTREELEVLKKKLMLEHVTEEIKAYYIFGKDK